MSRLLACSAEYLRFLKSFFHTLSDADRDATQSAMRRDIDHASIDSNFEDARRCEYFKRHTANLEMDVPTIRVFETLSVESLYVHFLHKQDQHLAKHATTTVLQSLSLTRISNSE